MAALFATVRLLGLCVRPGCPSLVSVVCFQVGVFATGLSLAQKSPVERARVCGCVCVLMWVCVCVCCVCGVCVSVCVSV